MDDSMLGKGMRLLGGIPDHRSGVTIDILERLASADGDIHAAAVSAVLNKQQYDWTRALEFPEKKTNLLHAIRSAEIFTQKGFELVANLRNMFEMPKRLPWKNVIVAFVPKGTDYRGCVTAMEKAGDGMERTFEENNVMGYSNSGPSDKDRLFIVRSSERPDDDTMNLAPDQLVATKKTFLGLGAYAIVMGTYHEATNTYLDRKTQTWFPNDRLAGFVARGGRNGVGRKVNFYLFRSYDSDHTIGARMAVEVPLKS